MTCFLAFLLAGKNAHTALIISLSSVNAGPTTFGAWLPEARRPGQIRCTAVWIEQRGRSVERRFPVSGRFGNLKWGLCREEICPHHNIHGRAGILGENVLNGTKEAIRKLRARSWDSGARPSWPLPGPKQCAGKQQEPVVIGSSAVPDCSPVPNASRKATNVADIPIRVHSVSQQYWYLRRSR